jgi:hypothetical protein
MREAADRIEELEKVLAKVEQNTSKPVDPWQTALDARMFASFPGLTYGAMSEAHKAIINKHCHD